MRKTTLLATGLLFFSTAYAQDPAIVQVATVSKAEITPTIAVPGTIYSRNVLEVTAGVTGQLERVAEPGTVIQMGDPIAVIDKRTLMLQRAEQEALLQRAGISERQLASQLKRQLELRDSDLVSQYELEQTQAAHELALNDANISKVRIRQIDDQIRRATVRAPFTGIVTERMHRGGEDVARGDVLARLTDLDNLEVRAFVPLKQLPRTIVGDAIDVVATGVRQVGRIRALVPTGDVRSQTFVAHIDLPPTAIGLWTVGQLVSVAIPIRLRTIALTVPRDALVLRQDGVFVFRINPDNKAERIPVEVGDSTGDLVAVSGALAEGDRVAIRGAESLSEGVGVRIVVAQSN